jgi:hypothetical protein
MRGEIGFEPALRARVALLRGLPTSSVDHVLRTRITLTPGALTLVATMRSAGAYAALVSGGFTTFTGAIAARLGFDEQRANTLIEADGKLTGQVGEPCLRPLRQGSRLGGSDGQAPAGTGRNFGGGRWGQRSRHGEGLRSRRCFSRQAGAPGSSPRRHRPRRSDWSPVSPGYRREEFASAQDGDA